MSSVVPFPQLSEIDRQFVDLEKQREIIREQAKLITKESTKDGSRKLR
jgi:hypothetical protein